MTLAVKTAIGGALSTEMVEYWDAERCVAEKGFMSLEDWIRRTASWSGKRDSADGPHQTGAKYCLILQNDDQRLLLGGSELQTGPKRAVREVRIRQDSVILLDGSARH